MGDLTGKRIAIAGAGVFGLSVALRAVIAGATVELWDPAAEGENASSVAAGMIAPIGETLFDPAVAAPLKLLRDGRDGWPALAALAQGVVIDRSGAIFRFQNARKYQAAVDLCQRAGVILSMDPGSDGQPFTFWTPEDWRIEPLAAIRAIKAAVVSHGAIIRPQLLGVDNFSKFDAVVIAAGIESRSFAALAPELTALAPIKGQMVRFAAVAQNRPILRTADLYIVSQGGEVLAGATMEIGKDDRKIDDAMVVELRRRALRLMPELEASACSGQAGVRASTPDGLPLAGPASRPGVYMATGARRNGWLLAPLVSEILVSYFCGGDGGPYAAALDPRRFTRA